MTRYLRADFLPDDELGLYQGARCELPDGEVIEVTGRRTPLYDLARKLDALGFGDWRLQSYTPTGTASLRGLVKAMAGLAVEESDKGGFKLRKYRPFSRGRSATDGYDGVSGTRVPELPQLGSAAPIESGRAVA